MLEADQHARDKANNYYSRKGRNKEIKQQVFAIHHYSSTTRRRGNT
jgi:uncharacterized protein YjlB